MFIPKSIFERFKRSTKALAVEPVPPLELWTCWSYDKFPYLLSGKVKNQLLDGWVEVEGYSGMKFKPLYMATGAAGKKMDQEIKHIRSTYRLHQELARNAAGQVAKSYLKNAGIPEQILHKLTKSGFQGMAYQELFTRLLVRD